MQSTLNRYAISKSEEETNERETYALFDDFQFYRSNKQLASALSPVLSQQHVYTGDASLMRPILLRSLLSLDTQRSEGREENTDHEQTASNDDEQYNILDFIVFKAFIAVIFKSIINEKVFVNSISFTI